MNTIRVQLRDGTTVLGKVYKGAACALTYSNRAQAYRATTKHGGEVIGFRPFYVRMPGKADPLLGPCSCRPGVHRDNCPNCEGTGMAIDFAEIHRRKAGVQ